MKDAFLFLCLFLFSSCSSLTDTGRANTTTLSREILNQNQVKPTTSLPVDCDDSTSYEVDVVEDEIRQARNVVLLVGGKPQNVVQLPNQTEVKGYALNWAKKTKEGIKISVEYGSRFYFDKRFIFECKKGGFHLTRIKGESFDKHKPAIWTNDEVKIKPSIPLADFKITNYLTGK